MSTETQLAPSSPTRAFPRPLWIGGGLLGLAGAALAGAMVMRSVDAPSSAPLALASTTAQPATGSVPEGVNSPANSTMTPPVGQPVPSSAHAPASPAKLAHAPAPVEHVAAACTSCGVVESVSAVQDKGEGTGLGAVAGGVLGGVVGHQAGGGHGKTALTILGAVGGGLAGNEVEKRARATTHYDIHVRMADGSHRVFRRNEALAVGARVVADGTSLRIATS